MRETPIEKHLAAVVRAAGGYAFKFVPIVAGMPDRIVLLPGGRVRFVELKTRTGATRVVQLVWHGRFEKLGFPVAMIRSKDEADQWIREQETS